MRGRGRRSPLITVPPHPVFNRHISRYGGIASQLKQRTEPFRRALKRSVEQNFAAVSEEMLQRIHIRAIRGGNGNDKHG